MAEVAIKANSIEKYFYSPEKFRVLRDISFEVNRGEFVSVVGKSGCGKSTLLYILSTMDTDYEGDMFINNQRVTGLSQNNLAQIRNQSLGFVFQFHYLLPDFSSLKNVMIPALRAGNVTAEEAEYNAMEKLKLLGVADQAFKKAGKLSGGQQQRVAIARALINNPSIIMGDEPTGNLDSYNTGLVYSIFRRLADEFHKTIITVTHDQDFANKSDRIIELRDGEIIRNTRPVSLNQ